ncbi:MAG TPA: hypothetical protein DCP28_02530, partial [Cytophagales bacterium]|nr:hypothetical protein [Cytophagales bacterium]
QGGQQDNGASRDEFVVGQCAGGTAERGGSTQSGPEEIQANLAAHLVLYPNPSQGTVHLRAMGYQPEETVTLQIIDLSGRTHHVQSLTADAQGQLAITLEGSDHRLAPGLYQLRLLGSSARKHKALRIE